MTTEITASQVKELREKTGAGLMDAKKALVETGGDMEKAAEYLRQKGILSAEKKMGRAAAEGVIIAKIADDAKTGVLLEINCETDFVARGEIFLTFAEQIAAQALTSSASSAEAFLQEKSAVNAGQTIDEFVKAHIGTIKENLSVRRLVRYSLDKPGFISSYIHTGSKIGVLLELGLDKAELAAKDEFKQLARDLTLHIASVAPEFVTRDAIPASVIEEEKRIEMGKEDLQSKPEEIREKIVNGRMDKILAQRVFLEQPFVKDPNQTITELVAATGKALGGTITVNRFERFLLGDGIEKKQDNFAEEVMAQMKA